MLRLISLSIHSDSGNLHQHVLNPLLYTGKYEYKDKANHFTILLAAMTSLINFGSI